MQEKKQTVHLLLLDPSLNDAEHTISVLRNDGKATRAHRITSEEDLQESLKAQSWDLLIAKREDQELTYIDCLDAIKAHSLDLPLIAILDDFDEAEHVAALQKGARQVVLAAHETVQLYAIRRELEDHADRRKRKSVELQLRDAERRCNSLLESSVDPIAYIIEGMHVFANKAYLELFGYDDLDDLICIPILDAIASSSTSAFKTFLKQAEGPDALDTPVSVCIERADGSEEMVAVSSSLATFEGDACLQLVMRPQVDAELEAKLKKISREDLLTGLYNKSYWMEQLHVFIEQIMQQKAHGFVMYIQILDLARLKESLGITGTDTLLASFATLLREHKGAHSTLGRFSDDSFVWLEAENSQDHVQRLASTISQAAEKRLFDISGKTAQVRVAIGLLRLNENSGTTETVVSKAIRASVYAIERPEASRQGGQTAPNVYMYNGLDFEDSDKTIDDYMAMLQAALDDNRFKMLFQPIISLQGSTDGYYEAFLRMIDNEGKEISPSDFLPVETEPRLATKLDRWVILQNVKSLSSHRSKGYSSRLIINITGHTITDDTFIDWLQKALTAAKLPGESLVFQVAEADVTEYLLQAKEFSTQIHKLGCQLALSRFGCALDPFKTLDHVEVDYVKVDGSYTEDIQKTAEAREAFYAMVDKLKDQSKMVITPLVENATVLSTLYQAGVHYIQGYYLQAPTTEMNYDFAEGG